MFLKFRDLYPSLVRDKLNNIKSEDLNTKGMLFVTMQNVKETFEMPSGRYDSRSSYLARRP